MEATYEIWLTDDIGTRIVEFKNFAFFSYSRSLLGLGTFNIGLIYKEVSKILYPLFEVDRRIEVWRSPDIGYPLRREGVFFLRKPRIYTRESDGVTIFELYGRSPIDLLRRRVIIQDAGTSYTTKTGTIDNIMKEIVREQMLYGSAMDEDGVQDNDRAYPRDSFFVQNNVSLGPTVEVSYVDRNVLDVLKELKAMSFQKNKDDSTNRKIYFDVVPYSQDEYLQYVLEEDFGIITDEDGNEFEDEQSNETFSYNGLRFTTYADLYGLDRTSGTIFSVENENLRAPFYSDDHLEEVNAVIVKGAGTGESRQVSVVQDDERVYASRWNRCEAFLEASGEPDATALADLGRAELWEGEPIEQVTCIFLNSPGGPNAPRSLYGIDWDLGDILPVSYAGKEFECEVAIVYVSLNENSEENITGRNEVNNQGDDA